MKTCLLLILALALCSCAGSGEGGSWTPADTTATVNAIGQTYDTGSRIYRDYQSGYRAQPVVAPVAPVMPVYPSVYP